jgi:uncharacterized membrane protein
MVMGMQDRDGGTRASVYLPFLLVVLVALIGFLRMGLHHWRDGSFLVGCALVLAAALRGLLSPEQAGLLALRSRAVDVLLYGGLGVVIMAVAWTITRGPFAY